MASQLPRFALASAREYRAGRWAGRVLSVLALWPISYAFTGKAQFDWGAMVVGGPVLVIGLLLAIWAGYRVRHPHAYLEIDHAAGLARLVGPNPASASEEPVVCRLDALGAWQRHEWMTTSRHQGVAHTTMWYAVSCPGYPDRKLFVDLDHGAREAWIGAVDAAVRGVAAKTETTIGERLAARLDAIIDGGRGIVATLMLIVLSGLLSLAVARSLAATAPGGTELAVILAIGWALLSLGWRAVRGPALASAFAAMAGAAYVAKPWVAPIADVWMGQRTEYSPTSETHMYFLVPGAGLLIVAAILFASIEVRARSQEVVARPVDAGIQLAPPRPSPPSPPEPTPAPAPAPAPAPGPPGVE